VLNSTAKPPANFGSVQADSVAVSGALSADSFTANSFGTVNATTVSADTVNITNENVENLNATNLVVAEDVQVSGNVQIGGNVEPQKLKTEIWESSSNPRATVEIQGETSSFAQAEYTQFRILPENLSKPPNVNQPGPVAEAYNISKDYGPNGDESNLYFKVYGVLEWKLGGVKIVHPADNTKWLRLSSTHSPQAEILLRGQVTLSSGQATVNLETEAGFSAGTWSALCTDPQVFTTNESGWSPVRGSLAGATLTVECQDTNSTDTVSWLVVARRHDAEITGAYYADDSTGVITVEQTIPNSNLTNDPLRP